MIGRESDHEDVVLKVVDRRMFNVDGSLREGVEIAEPKAEVPNVEVEESKLEVLQTAELEEFGETEMDDEDFPDAENPSSFVNFLSTLASQAATSLGAMPNPQTGQRMLDLETGKYWIEVLSMLKEKTEGNLHPKEAELFEGLLSDLKLQFVQISQMAAERAKRAV
jgi:hypothetical protein